MEEREGRSDRSKKIIEKVKGGVVETKKESEDLREEVIATVNAATDVLEKGRKILGRLCRAVGRWESEEKEGKGPWAFHTRGVPGIHEAQAQAQGEARQAQPGHCAAVLCAAASPLPATAPPPFIFAAPPLLLCLLPLSPL